MIEQAEQAAASADSAYDALQARFDSGLDGLRQQLSQTEKQLGVAVGQKEAAEAAASEATASKAKAMTAEQQITEQCARHVQPVLGRWQLIRGATGLLRSSRSNSGSSWK